MVYVTIGLESVATKDWMISENYFGKDVEGNGYGLS
jgi:hypothetical protein